MSLFTIGRRYQGDYTVEHIVPFFNGELVISKFLDERYYLQSAPLVREFTTLEFMRFKKLYDELNFELLLPVSDLYLEGDQMVFVYPYQPIQPIRDVVMGSGVSDEQILGWFHQIMQTEAALRAMGIPMYIVRDPRNIGLNAEGQLRVIFAGIEDVTYYQSTLNWGTFLYCIASGEYMEDSMKKLPSKHGVSKPVAKVLQKCFRAKNIPSLLTVIEQQLNKSSGKGFIGALFGGKKKKEADPAAFQVPEPTPTPVAPPLEQTTPIEPLPNEPTDNSTEELDWSLPVEDSNQSIQQDSFDWSNEQPVDNSADDISAQLEQMYQSMEADKQQVDHQTSGIDDPDLADTIVYNKPDDKQSTKEETPWIPEQNQASSLTDLTFDETAVFSEEETAQLSAQYQPNTEVTSNPTEELVDPMNKEESTPSFTRKPQTQSPEMDETQIFSASDLSSLEAELEAMQKMQQSEQQVEEDTEQASTYPSMDSAKDEPVSEDQTFSQMKELEDLFGELEQLQQQGNQEPDPVPTEDFAQTQVMNTLADLESASQQQPTTKVDVPSNLDSKVQELESLFDEINQLQAQEKQSTSGNESQQFAVEDDQALANEVDEIEQLLAQQMTANAEEQTEVEEAPQALKFESNPQPELVPEPEPDPEPQPVDPLEKLKLSFEERQRELLEQQRKKFEERKQELINQAQEEMQRRQQALLSEIEQQEETILAQLKEDLAAQEQKQLELEKQEQERITAEFEQQRQEELRKLELSKLEQQHEEQLQESLEALRVEYAEKEKQQRKELEQEWQSRIEAMVERLAAELSEREATLIEEKQKEWEQIVRAHEQQDDEETVAENENKTNEEETENTETQAVTEKAKKKSKSKRKRRRNKAKADKEVSTDEVAATKLTDSTNDEPNKQKQPAAVAADEQVKENVTSTEDSAN